MKNTQTTRSEDRAQLIKFAVLMIAGFIILAVLTAFTL
jgi:nitrate reductase NapE component